MKFSIPILTSLNKKDNTKLSKYNRAKMVTHKHNRVKIVIHKIEYSEYVSAYQECVFTTVR